MDVQSPPSRSYARVSVRARRRRRPAWRKRVLSVIVLTLLTVVMVTVVSLVAYRIARSLQLLSRESRETRMVEMQVNSLRRENTSLERRIKHLQTPQGAKVAARKLGYVKPGEVTLVLPDTSKKPSR